MRKSSTLSLEAKVAAAAGAVLLSMAIARNLMSERFDINVRATLYRVQFLLFINSFMLLGSLFVWRRIASAVILGAKPPSPWLYQAWRAALECMALCRRTFSRVRAKLRSPAGTEATVAGAPGALGRQALLAVALTVTLCTFGLMNASLPPQVVRLDITLDKLPRSLDGLKIVLLSDIHLGSTVGRSRLDLIVSIVNRLEADLVAITGDLADSQVSRLLSASEPLLGMKSKLGSYFVTGNHDYYTADVEAWFAHLRALNIQALHNDHARISQPGQKSDWLCLAGVDDLEARILRYPGHGMNVAKALEGCSPDRPIVLLAHQPRAARWALQERPDIGLVLSGHTHAGQIFPLSIMAYLLNPYFCGLYRVGDSSLVYVSPGTAHYGIPMRIGSRAEVTEILLRAP
ncbi:transmembrane protein with metallophosphoesterase domain isoform X3 [Brienomyrus brachyistius]|uniref:transmembrane protein with metallophosphoesterase domain isoform X3 n=1 Tax=Brienomyrus brachyistius TaxID=42636 RepID=UPI0020B2F785|nr:transmembrane protein with metallophosphoesterase domain isoform X3 [Brienomyrus brachyistius]